MRSRALGALCALMMAASMAGGMTAKPAGALPVGTPRISIGGGSVVEGGMTRRYIRFAVGLSWRTDQVVTATFSTADGTATSTATATSAADFRAVTKTVTFLPRQTAKYISVLVWPDWAAGEGDETFTASLSNVTGATVDHSTGTGTIIDDDDNVALRGVSIGDATVPEHCGAPSISAPLVLTLGSMRPDTVTVAVTTAPATATPALDYLPVTKSVSFASGVVLREVRVPIYPDLLDTEGSETFTVSIALVSGPTTIGRATGTVTILDCTPA